MHANDIVEEEILTVSPEDNPVDVGNRMLEKRISNAAVMEDGKLIGLVSKVTFVLSLEQIGQKPLEEFKVRDLMEKKYRWIEADATLEEVVGRMMEMPSRMDRILVMDEGRLRGTIPKANIVRLFARDCRKRFKVKDLMEYKPSVVYDYVTIPKLIKELTMSSDKKLIVCSGEMVAGIITVLDLAEKIFKKMRAGEDYKELTAADMMTKDPITISSREDSAKAADIMLKESIGGLPAVDKKLEGIITKSDIVKGYQIVLQKI
ncbi:MAG: CBS domain-containing protein [Candidatus Altiarchaeota archaeon]